MNRSPASVAAPDSAGRPAAGPGATGRFRIGRQPDCDIVVPDGSVSRNHAELRFLEDGSVLLVDSGSTGGTWLLKDGKASEVTDAVVYDDTLLQLGEVTLSLKGLLAALRQKHPTFAGRLPPPPEAEKTADTLPLPVPSTATCPVCQRPSDSLKRYTLVHRLVFVGLAYTCQLTRCVACPTCMRRIIRERTLANLLSANVAWPLVVVPWHALAYVRSFGRGRGHPQPHPRDRAP